jgi:hypothetical protein
MKKTLTLILYVIAPFTVFSQKITGTVINEKNQVIKDASVR